jgi:hypothetical protein
MPLVYLARDTHMLERHLFILAGRGTRIRMRSLGIELNIELKSHFDSPFAK